MRPLARRRRRIRWRSRNRTARVAFEPGIDPLRLDPYRSAPADACMLQFAPFTGGVDGVAADAGIDRAFGNGADFWSSQCTN